MGHPGLGGKVAFPARGHLHAQQFGQHVSIGQLLAGGEIKSIVQDLHGLLEAQGLQVLTGLLQGNHRHRTPPAASS